MDVQRYNKAIVAVIWAGLLIWRQIAPESSPDATQEDVVDWVAMTATVLGPLLVYAIPNRADT